METHSKKTFSVISSRCPSILKWRYCFRYFQYDGSFTTPTCDEGVKWNVIADYCVVPQSLLDLLATFPSMDGNFRPPQPLNGRHIAGSKFYTIFLLHNEIFQKQILFVN